MAKTRRKRPQTKTKRRPPNREAAPRLGQTTSAPTQRMYVGRSRRARRAQYTRTAAIAGGALGFLVAVLIIWSPGGGSLPIRPIDTKVLSTTVRARSKPDTALQPLADGDKIRENAVIETDAAGLGEFTFADGSVLRVGPSSEYDLTRARTNGKHRSIAGRLVGGKSWHHVAKTSGSDKYAVSVLGASGEVKGTSFAVECEVENDCTYTVVRGIVKVKDAVDHTAELREFDEVEVKFGRLEPVQHLTEAQVGSKSWIAQNISLDGGTSPPTTEVETTTTLGDTTTIAGEPTTTVVGGVQVPTSVVKGTPTTRSSTGTTQATSPGTTTATTKPPSTTVTTSHSTTTATTVPPTTTTKVKHCDQKPKPAGCP